ncbi:unnamed protein product [Mytilus edulis]|uniref:B box-type domain-containing protein n=1 Tax=Mytilus edulis TaxID=6550 RepID=A0A8S3SUP4_MYTED|nr:unnamed protein product [Mytilus edulis]
MASTLRCGPCSRMDKLATAVKFCTDCEDYLCTDCVHTHTVITALASHHLIQEDIQTDEALNIKRMCSDHPDMVLEFHCSKHDRLICRTCSVNRHRRCGKMLPINVAARGIKRSVMLNDVTANLKDLLKIAEQLKEDRAKNMENIRESKATTLQKIAKFKREVIQELDELEKKLMIEVDVTEKRLTRKAESDLSDIEIRRKALVEMLEHLDILTTHGSEIQILMLLNTIRMDISKQENDFYDVIPSYRCTEIYFKDSTIKSYLKSLGSAELKYYPCSIVYRPHKHAEAQIPSKYDKIPLKQKNKKIDVPYRNGYIFNIVVMNDNRLLLCFSGVKSKALSLWSETGDYIQDCALAESAWGIVWIQGTNEAIVTLPSIRSVQFVNIANMTSGKVMTVPDSCYGVTVIKNEIVLGTGIFSYKSPDFEGPVDLALDGEENLYVITRQSNKLHCLSSDWKLHDILLKAENGLRKPYAVAFNYNYNKLYIANGHYDEDKQVMIFDCA